jgi:hypothetical protein
VQIEKVGLEERAQFLRLASRTFLNGVNSKVYEIKPKREVVIQRDVARKKGVNCIQ